MVTEMISSNVIKITNLKSIPILNYEDKVLGLRLVDDSSLSLGECIVFKDYNGQSHKDIINRIDVETEFNYFVTIGNTTSFKEFILPLYSSDADSLKYTSHCYDVEFSADTVDLIYYFDYEIDSVLSSSKYFKSYSPIEGKCCYTMYIPKRFKDDYLLILQGQYSKTSTNYKSRVLSFFLGKPVLFTDSEKITILANSNVSSTMYIETASKLNAIFIKSSILRSALEKKLNVNINTNQELYTNPQWQKQNN